MIKKHVSAYKMMAPIPIRLFRLGLPRRISLEGREHKFAYSCIHCCDNGQGLSDFPVPLSLRLPEVTVKYKELQGKTSQHNVHNNIVIVTGSI